MKFSDGPENQKLHVISAGSDRLITIKRSTSFNFNIGELTNKRHTSEKAHDRDLSTSYAVKDGEVAGNFLKLFLSQPYFIWEIKITNRGGDRYINRLKNTEVKVYSTVDGLIEVRNCGTITGKTLEGFFLIDNLLLLKLSITSDLYILIVKRMFFPSLILNGKVHK